MSISPTRYSTTSRSSTILKDVTQNSATELQPSTNGAPAKPLSLLDPHTSSGNQAVGHVNLETKPSAIPTTHACHGICGSLCRFLQRLVYLCDSDIWCSMSDEISKMLDFPGVLGAGQYALTSDSYGFRGQSLQGSLSEKFSPYHSEKGRHDQVGQEPWLGVVIMQLKRQRQ